jgi:hypothetical protein
VPRADPARVLLAALALAGCRGQIVVGADVTDDAAADSTTPDSSVDVDATSDLDAASDTGLTPLLIPWSTGFENGLDDWTTGGQGFCYVQGGATYPVTVTSPVHGGTHSGAFTVDSPSSSPSESRCLREGVLPQSGYYGAWYYVSAAATNEGNWNLFHFQGADVADGAATHNLWDVSLTNDADGGLDTSVYDFLRSRSLEAGMAIPIATWFHLEVFLHRAADATGEFTLYRDGQVVLDLTALATDDSLWGQWHLGNLATALSPPSSTLYIDDVTIGTTQSAP